MAQARYNRPPKFDRITSPDARAVETEIYYTLAPFDEAVRAADLKWGQDRLPGLVSPEMAQKYGKAVAALNAAIMADDPEATRQNAANCAKGLAAMDRAATEAGATPADTTVFEISVDGNSFAIIRDGRAWPALKAARPDLVFYTDREVANAMRAYMSAAAHPMVEAVQAAFPTAQITSIKPRNASANADLEDEIPY